MVYFQIVAVFIIFGMVLLSNYNKNVSKSKGKPLPGPKKYPYIGSILKLASMKRKMATHLVYDKICEEYGPVVSLKAGVLNLALVQDYKMAKDIMHSDAWVARLSSKSAFKDLLQNRDAGIMFNDGSSWKENRRFVLKLLRDAGVGVKCTMEINGIEEAGQFMDSFESSRAQDNLILFHQMFKMPTLNILWRNFVGGRFEYTDHQMRDLISMIESLTTTTNVGQAFCSFPILKHVPLLTTYKSSLEATSRVTNLFKNIIIERRKNGTYKSEDQKDFLSAYMNKIDESRNTKDEIVFNDEMLIQSCVDIFIAGMDTSGITLEFLMLNMITFPHIQKKAHEEIDRNIPQGETPSLSDMEKLPYIQGIIYESFRYSTITAVIPRTCVEDTMIGEYFVPKDTIALINFFNINHDEKVWENPYQFNPERFLDSDGNIDVKIANQIFSFGFGKRFCIGATIAKASIFVFFTTFMHRYSVEAESEEALLKLKHLSILREGVSNKPVPFYGIVKKRF